jgi:hypothetical protein
MDKHTPEALVNRDEPVPGLNITPKAERTRSPSLQDRLFTKYDFSRATRFPDI